MEPPRLAVIEPPLLGPALKRLALIRTLPSLLPSRFSPPFSATPSSPFPETLPRHLPPKQIAAASSSIFPPPSPALAEPRTHFSQAPAATPLQSSRACPSSPPLGRSRTRASSSA